MVPIIFTGHIMKVYGEIGPILFFEISKCLINTVPSLKSPHPFIKHFFIATVKCLFWNIYSCTHILWKWEQFEICDKWKNINVCQCKKQLHRSVQWVAACVGDNHMMINDKNSCIDSHFLLSLSGTASSYPWPNDQRLTVTEMLLV